MPFSNCVTLLSIVFCLAIRIQHSLCLGVKFTLPAPGATWPAGDVTVNWTDAGGSPDMNDLTTYSLVLMVGGNSPTNSKAVTSLGGGASGAMIKDGGVEVNIPANVGQSIQNGYYLCLTSNTTTGNQVINYSDRFTLIQMNGTTDQTYVMGASSSVGDDNVPTPQYNVISQSSSSTATSSQTASATTTSGATATSTSTSAANEQYSISGGTLAGLAIGTISAVVLFLILAVMLLLWFRKRRRARKTRRRSEADKLPDTALQNWGDKVELSARPTSTLPRSRASPAELSPEQERFEVGESVPAAELAATRQSVYELESDWSGWEAAARKSRHGAYDPTL